ncbi:MAG TPA: hypothetical protein VIV11_16300 [Kofleriaceae bacterium]
MRKLTTLCLFAALASQLGNTNCGQALRDPGYDLWCGDDLCAWKVERGEIKRVATWHEGDSGVELVGTDTAIMQLSPVDSADGQCRDNPDGSTTCTSPDDVCLEFSLLANIDDTAVVDLNIDVLGDGTFEHTQRLPIAKWQPLSYKIVIGQPFAGVRFQLAKSGPGVAQLANIGAELARNCDGLPVIDPGQGLLGAPCKDPSDCASGICGMSESPVPFPGVSGFLMGVNVCLGCSPQQNCSTGSVCGVGEASSPVRAQETVCIPFNEKQLGESCFWFNECASNYCTGGVCSTCKDNAQCAGGEQCGEGWDAVFSAWVCSPNAGVRQIGEPCVSHADCASGTCNGTERMQCDDGRACATAAQCPFKDGLKNGPCTTVGIQGGSCQ